MPVRIIDNKKVDMTEDEWALYQKIVKSYTIPPNKGEDYFMDLFETDNNGIIIFLKPPSQRRTSFEIFLFLMALFQHQHIRMMHNQVDDIVNQMKTKMSEIEQKIELLDKK